MEENKILLETQALTKYFKTKRGNLHAVDEVDLTLPAGETLGVVGESGCGKSTLGRTILKLIEPTAGKIIFNGEDITSYSPNQMKRLREDMQIIFQDPYSSIDPRKTVAQAIAEPLIISKRYKNKQEMYDYVRKMMDTVGLAQRLFDAYPHELDGGRRQRIGVARALAMNPKLIICDEPVSALDVSIQAQILNLLMDLQDEMGLAYLFITHDLSVVKHIADNIMVMYMGRCIEKAPANELFRNPTHPYTQALLASIPVPSSAMRKKKLKVIRGEVTSPIEPKPCCRFAARCPYATDLCRSQEPKLEKRADGHYVACFHEAVQE